MREENFRVKVPSRCCWGRSRWVGAADHLAVPSALNLSNLFLSQLFRITPNVSRAQNAKKKPSDPRHKATTELAGAAEGEPGAASAPAADATPEAGEGVAADTIMAEAGVKPEAPCAESAAPDGGDEAGVASVEDEEDEAKRHKERIEALRKVGPLTGLRPRPWVACVTGLPH